MSQRNTLETKRARREAKLKRQKLPAYFDVIQWVKNRAHMSTGRAIKVIQAGSIKAGSHTLQAYRGAQLINGKIVPVRLSHYPTDLLPDIRVETPEILKGEE